MTTVFLEPRSSIALSFIILVHSKSKPEISLSIKLPETQSESKVSWYTFMELGFRKG